MMTYTHLLEEFKQGIQSALISYQKLYREQGKVLPDFRVQDIAAIKELINRHGDSENLRQDLVGIINAMKTGWWFIRTGKSHLKHSLESIVNHQAYSTVAFLKACQFELNLFKNGEDMYPPAPIAHVNETITSAENDKEVSDANAQEVIHQLKKENTKLKEANQTLSKLIEKLHQEQSEIENCKKVESPSSLFSRSLDDISMLDGRNPGMETFMHLGKTNDEMAMSGFGEQTFFNTKGKGRAKHEPAALSPPKLLNAKK